MVRRFEGQLGVLAEAIRTGDSAMVTGDKSISHGAIILGEIAEGSMGVAGFLEGEETTNRPENPWPIHCAWVV